MFTISVKTYFWASHQLTLPDGSKERPHHHNWSVTADVSSSRLNKMGLVMDFHRLKAMLDETIAGFQDATLDKSDYFRRNNPSAENAARYIYEQLQQRLPEAIELRSITVAEEQGCSAKFSR